MMKKSRVMHYVNQFFAGMGGEKKADLPVGSHRGPIGPGKRLQELLGDSADIVVTTFCGDNYFAERHDEALASILEIAKKEDVEMVVAGPAFVAGRYGFACVEVCHFLSHSLGLFGAMGMNVENPGVEVYKQYKDRRIFLLPTVGDLRGMEDALSRMAKLTSRLAAGIAIGLPSEEGYIPRGIRIDEMGSKSGVDRAVDMLIERLAGRTFSTEIPVESLEEIPITPPISNVKDACLALACTGGVTAFGNPDGFKVLKNTKWNKYSIGKLNSMTEVKWEVVHGGYNTVFMEANPNYGVPVDACRQMEREGAFGHLYPYFYGTSGVTTTMAAMQAVGREMAQDMKAGDVNAVLLVST
jgi:betaine reductase